MWGFPTLRFEVSTADGERGNKIIGREGDRCEMLKLYL